MAKKWLKFGFDLDDDDGIMMLSRSGLNFKIYDGIIIEPKIKIFMTRALEDFLPIVRLLMIEKIRMD
ncbi:MAG: hypothetical protein RR495_01585 [Anaerovoracaceae bacterium]